MTWRKWKDRASGGVFALLTAVAVLIVVVIGGGLWWKARPITKTQSIGQLLLSDNWKPFSGHFGFWGYIAGSLTVTAIAILIALPVSVLAAVYLSEFAPARLKKWLLPFIDLLSGIPPIIYGVWGVLTVVPVAGYSALSGGVVLAVMI